MLKERSINTQAYMAADSIMNIVNEITILLVENHKLAFNLLWHNQNATPQEILQALGDDAKFVFDCAEENLVFLNTCATYNNKTINDLMTPQEYTPPVQYQKNNDGTVSII